MRDYQHEIEIGVQLLELFIQDVPRREEGVQKALETGDEGLLKENLHSLSNNLSAMRLYEMGTSVIELEKAVKKGDIDGVAHRFPGIRERLGRAIEEAWKYLDMIRGTQ
jgi:HPt (histidine-containing phosphotransfer) domain-containing protein